MKIKLLIYNMLVVLLMAGCTTTRYVPTVREVYRNRVDTVSRVDSVVIRDSIVQYTKGDTVYLTKLKDRTLLRYVYKTSTDTLLKTDTIVVEKTVEKPLRTSQKAFMKLGWAFALLLIVAAVLGVLRLVRSYLS